MKKRFIGLLFLFCLSGCLHAQTNAGVWGIDTLQWKGFDRYVLKFTSPDMHDTFNAFETAPTKSSKGNPWIWRARFPEWHTEDNTFKLIENYLKLGGIATVIPCTKGKQSLEGHHFPIEIPRDAADFIAYRYQGYLGSRVLVNNADEISQAMQTAQAGDMLIMSNGVWKNQQIVFEGNGTAALPIVLMAQTPGKVILSGKSNLKIAGSHLLVTGLLFRNGLLTDGSIIEFRNEGKQASNCRLTNTVIDAYNPSSDTVDYKWISLYGTHNRVDHCAIQGKNHQGPTVVVWLDGKPNYHKIDHNYFGPMPELGRNGAETIRIGTSGWSKTDSYTTVEYNYFDRVDGEIETVSNKSGHNTIQYNTFYHCKGTITLRHGNNALIKGNVFLGGYKLGTGGIRVIGENHVIINNYFQNLNPGDEDLRAAISIMNAEINPKLTGYWQVKNVLIANNTLVNNTKGIVVGSGVNKRRVLSPLDCKIYNNLLLGDSGELLVFKDKPVGFSFKKNLIYGDKAGIPKHKGVILLNPKLVRVNEIWRLEKNSPAIDFGQALKAVEYDMDGQSRDDGLIDIGADEYAEKPNKKFAAPMSPSEVGPKIAYGAFGKLK